MVRPAVVPKNARPQDLCVPVEQHGAMHLARKPNPGDGRDLNGVVGRERVDRFEGRVPPILGVLFAPTRPRALHRESDGGAADDPFPVVDKDRLHGGGAEINPEEHQLDARRAASSSVRSIPDS